MKKLLLIAIASIFSIGAWADNNPLYQSNSFGVMPHDQIMKINMNQCGIEANAIGDAVIGEDCKKNQQTAFDKLKVIYNDHAITAPSWSLCIAESKIPNSYNYVVMYACMKVVKDICKEKSDGQWENPALCVNSIKSRSWLHNPKIYQPYKKQ